MDHLENRRSYQVFCISPYTRGAAARRIATANQGVQPPTRGKQDGALSREAFAFNAAAINRRPSDVTPIFNANRRFSEWMET
jgi:hypothetical protein